MKAVRNFSRLIIAPVFIFSGFVKAIDPLGSAYKFTDYFEAFGLNFLTPIALVLAILLSTAELVIGLSIMMGTVMRVTSWALLLFMSFFTTITLISAITNPVTDCGCFGDALILTNWQTFWKNLFFMVPTLVLFYGRKRFKPFGSIASEWGVITLFIAVGISLSVYTYNNLPVFDFRPYTIGTDIRSSMEIPEGAAIDEYETVFVYSKDGVEQDFEIENIPYTDTLWKYVDRKTTLIKKGYKPEIHDFTIATQTGDDITDSVLANADYSLLVIAYNLDKSNYDGLIKANELATSLKDKGVVTYGMTASTSAAISKISDQQNFNFNFHTTDEITLKTIVRSNPGIVLLKEGVIVGKWHYKNLPETNEFESGILPLALNYQLNRKNKTALGFYLLLLLSLFSTLTILVKSSDY